MTDQALPDAGARLSIARDLDVNMLVEAGAGSGKTTCLVERMAALITAGECGAQNLAAVTFTRKAAGELRERFQQHLEEQAGTNPDREAAHRAELALDNLENTFIGTIHSFCARLLRERPVEAGLRPDFRELEGLEEQMLLRRAWEDYLLQIRLDAPEQVEELARVDLAPEDLQEAFEQMVTYPDLQLVRGESPLPELGELRQELGRLLEHAKQVMPAEPPEKGWDGLGEVLDQGRRWTLSFDLGDHRYFLRLVARMQKKPDMVKKRWPDPDAASELKRRLESFQELAKPVLRAWRERRHGPALDFLLPAVEHYRQLRYRANRLNYQDLLLRGAELLRAQPEVRKYFQARFSHLLVDEFQDTDPIQAQVMMYLAGEDVYEQDWKKITLRPGSLFVVGDPKQSIYRFRRADINVYLQVKDQIRQSGGMITHLTSNFRSVPSLIRWGNDVFAELLGQEELPYQAEFVPMEPVRAGGGAEGAVRLDLPEPERSREKDIVEMDARRVAAWVRQCLDDHVELSRGNADAGEERLSPAVPEDFLLLVRRKNHMSVYARALDEQGVPSRLSGEGELSNLPELNHLLHLLQAVSDPEDQVALVSALRGEIYGFSDTELYQFRRAGGVFSYLEDLPPGLPTRQERWWRQCWEQLRSFRRWSIDLPPSAVLQRIMRETGLLSLALAGELPERRAGCLLQALELLRSREQAGETSFGDAVEYLGRLLEEGVEEALDLQAGSRSAVRIMNLHKAKGLEAPVVVLANPSPKRTRPPAVHVRRASNPGEPEQAFVPVQTGGYQPRVLAQPPDWEEKSREEERFRRGEEMRLLYVAATRARNLLVVSSLPRDKGAGENPWKPLGPWLQESLALKAVAPAPGTVPGRHRAWPVSASLLRRENALRAWRRQDNARPSYRRETVTGLVQPILPGEEAERAEAGEAEGEEAVAAAREGRERPGKGPQWGQAVHAMLQAALDGRVASSWEPWAREMTRYYGLEPGREMSLVRTMKRVSATTLWHRARNALTCLTEVPLATWNQGVSRQGTCDLAFREPGGWVLVDFKTDYLADEEELQARARHYAPQLEGYARLWIEATGEAPVEYGVLFTGWGRYVNLSP